MGKWLFSFWQRLATKIQKKIIMYYGVVGHGKALVDAMGSFGAKEPIKKGVLTSNFSYNSASDIVSYLKCIFSEDNTKFYYEIT